MTKPTIKIHDALTGEVQTREMNLEEFAQYEKDLLDAELRLNEQTTKATSKAALLTKLGITEDEARLLLS